MPAKNFLSPETKEKLQQVLKDHEHRDIRERSLIFLLLNDGKTQAKVAELIGCSLRGCLKSRDLGKKSSPGIG